MFFSINNYNSTKHADVVWLHKHAEDILKSVLTVNLSSRWMSVAQPQSDKRATFLWDLAQKLFRPKTKPSHRLHLCVFRCSVSRVPSSRVRTPASWPVWFVLRSLQENYHWWPLWLQGTSSRVIWPITGWLACFFFLLFLPLINVDLFRKTWLCFSIC